ncbi:hypothetical protein CABS01_08571 [Colletotrichum abscissum]|uniref:Uncharacterized protein n=2 Tax=Colletotrichum acutatum species complex TaxID=2707335 RepID=A0A9P9XGN9_9PEZI|nr:uncharacterized protein CLUP02_17481 [Colletotrichum lupini]XP_060402087.1 uncharacterized protein CABS01_08571 [Colletotrichum abscissum]KAI3554126.1 hypothetical protein CABS02_05541 [Colletotrichum abscissum]KAK1507391.1 hypothetical protein CABS01_08571 [Colletotrichum abscissum]UQC75971.1 hypothetical protein CLUP02_17481 [Colletotrichum lupini]
MINATLIQRIAGEPARQSPKAEPKILTRVQRDQLHSSRLDCCQRPQRAQPWDDPSDFSSPGRAYQLFQLGTQVFSDDTPVIAASSQLASV